MKVRVQGLNLAMEALDGCARLRGSEKNLFTIYVVSGHARTIGVPGRRQARLELIPQNLRTRLAGDKRQRHLDGGAPARRIHHGDGATVAFDDGVDNCQTKT